MSAVLSFIWILYLKKLLRCFCSLKFENSLFRNNPFSGLFRGKKVVYTAEKYRIKYFVQNLRVKITILYVKLFTASSRYCCCHKLRFFNFVESYKRIVHHLGYCRFLYYTMNEHHIRLNISSKYKRTRTM